VADANRWQTTLGGQRASFEARQLVRDACDAWPPEQVDTAQLLATELVANALLHGQGDIGLRIRVSGHLLRVEVSDESSTLPRLVDPPPTRADEAGRGLYIVDALAKSWGTRSNQASGGKAVWFELHQYDT
jgi:anti-sigma regulatory factor (Ser/Thr protein kinase)